MGTCISIIL